MKRRHASAPGKVFLAGEYAVLHGGPALVATVNRRADAWLADADDGEHVFEASGAVSGHWRFRRDDDGRATWLDEPPTAGGLALAEAVIARAPALAGASRLTVDSRSFTSDDGKLGFGSSAAVAVALSAVLGSDNVAQRAAAAHREFQGGRGSGADVAAAVAGGVIEVTGATEPRQAGWPQGLCARLIWSGRPASTRARLEQLEASLETAAGRDGMEQLVSASRAVAAGWHDGAAGALAGLSRWSAALDRFDRAVGLGIFSAGHGAMRDLAGNGVVYKPCGAGGGDIGAAFATDAEALTAFVAAAGARGYATIDAELGVAGLATGEDDMKGRT